jgi:hypothetical protein
VELSLLLFVVAVLVPLAGFAVWVWALIDVLRTPDGAFQTGTQLIWVLVVVLANIVGAIIYLVIGRPSPEARRLQR